MQRKELPIEMQMLSYGPFLEGFMRIWSARNVKSGYGVHERYMEDCPYNTHQERL